MTVTDLFSNLANGELNNLYLGDEGTGTIRTEDQPKIIRQGNAGLLRLYSRFILLDKTILVEMREAKVMYPLTSQYALSTRTTGSFESYYIIDTNEPFNNDIIKVLEVYDSLGRKLGLNDNEDRDSVFTPKFNVLQVPRPVPCTALGVRYQAKHPRLTGDLAQEIILPDVLEGALEAFIAWQIYANMNTQEAAANAQAHQANFESICGEAVASDLVNTSISTTNTKLEKRGWR